MWFSLEQRVPARETREVRLWLVVVLLTVHLAHARADEVDRVRAHLRAARVLLDSRDLSTLTQLQRERRSVAIAVLDRYIERGVFPRRTADIYDALRPRFIDDRGVHCAVGEMIAKTGFSELARRINAQYEYAFVRDIHSAELLKWAERYGFTVDELAAIQPSYSKPAPSDPDWPELRAHVNDLTLRCIGEGAPPKQVELTARISRGRTRISTAASDEFSRCFAAAAETFIKTPQFPVSMSFSIPALDRLMQLRLKPGDCMPRSGALPREATIDFANGSVATEPKNAEVDACLVAQLERTTEPFRRRVKVLAHIVIPPKTTSHVVERVLFDRAPGAAWKCVAHGDPKQINFVVRAKQGDRGFEISLPGANATFSACVRAELLGPLRALLSPRTTERIDSDIEATLSFSLIHEPSSQTRSINR